MRADTKPRSIEHGCSFDLFLSTLNNPAPAFAGPPQTLRDHIGKREFGDFGAVLLANRPPSGDLSNRVKRLRGLDVAPRDELPLHAHPDQIAEDRRFNYLFVVTPLAIMIWVLAGLIVAWMKGVL